MAIVTGVDTLDPVSTKLINDATHMLGGKPRFWGRYFKNVTDGVYRPATESPLLRTNAIALLPIARQTKHVAGTAVLGASDAKDNVAALIHAVGADRLAGHGTEFLMFLDVEGTAENPSLSAPYYTGWSRALIDESRTLSGNRFTIVPAVYARTKDDDTWKAIATAVGAGAEACRGAWVARGHSCDSPNPATFETAFLKPDVALAFPILLWQFKLDCPPATQIFDLDMANPDPNAGKFLLDRLATP
jgi:hypothetical protein